MKVIICIEDRGGMMFNKRRETRDRLVSLDMLVEAGASRLYIEPYSEKLFRGNEESVHVVENVLEETPADGCCFVEDRDLAGSEEKIDTLIIYRWNRVYPYDRKLDIDMGRYERTGRIEFAGYSHDCVTKDTFRRLPIGERREFGDEE